MNSLRAFGWGFLVAVIIGAAVNTCHASDWDVNYGLSSGWVSGHFTDERLMTLSVTDGRHEIALHRYEGAFVERFQRELPDLWAVSANRYWVFLRQSSVRPRLGLGGGYIEQPTYRGGCRAVFTLQAGLEIGDRFQLRATHFSNGGLCDTNKGYDFAGIFWRW
jgi:hypothetical protein